MADKVKGVEIDHVKEKLIAFIEQAGDKALQQHIPLTSEMIASYLVANGVTVLPCNVGDKIYYIDRFTHKVEVDTVKFLTITKNGVKPILTRHNIKFWDFYELGKTVFFTKEEAKAYLPEPPKGE